MIQQNEQENVLMSCQSGDSLQATDANNATWNTPQNVKSQLRYPKQGTGAVVTYVEVNVDQVILYLFAFILRSLKLLT